MKKILENVLDILEDVLDILEKFFLIFLLGIMDLISYFLIIINILLALIIFNKVGYPFLTSISFINYTFNNINVIKLVCEMIGSCIIYNLLKFLKFRTFERLKGPNIILHI